MSAPTCLANFRGSSKTTSPSIGVSERYAKALHISESSLNRVCRAVAGATAFQLITRRLEIEARRRLTYSTVPIHRIASDLGFADPFVLRPVLSVTERGVTEGVPGPASTGGDLASTELLERMKPVAG